MPEAFMCVVDLKPPVRTRHYLPPVVASWSEAKAAEILCGCRGRRWTREQAEVTCRKCRKMMKEAQP